MSIYDASSSDRRERILYAALLLFTGKGYANTSVHEIREKADVSIGLIYRYFKNKEEIAKSLYRELLTDVTAGIQQLIAENDTVAASCRAIMDYYFNQTENYPEVVDYVIFFRHGEIFSNVSTICAAEPAILIYQMLQEGIIKGEIRKMDPIVAQTAIFGGSARLMQMRIHGVMDTPLPELLDEVWECAWLAVKPE